MVIKVYTSGISGNKEVKKRQQRIMMILESKNIEFEAIDITEPGRESDKQFMQDNAKAKDSKHPLPPQIFNEDDYCGDYDGFDVSNENDELEIFLKMPLPPAPVIIEPPPPVVNGRTEHSTDKESSQPPELDSKAVSRARALSSVRLEPPRPSTSFRGLTSDDEEPPPPPPPPEEVVHGFCYTPSLAKRLEKALRARVQKEKPKPVHGYCFTPSLAQRLAKALERAYTKVKEEDKQAALNSDDPFDEDKDETESSLNDEEMEADGQNGDENAAEEEDVGDGDE